MTLPPRSHLKDYYAVLSVPADATAAELKDAHRDLVKQWHPDVWVSRGPELAATAHRELCEANEAYAVLSHADRRAAYDAGRTATRLEAQQQARHAAWERERGGLVPVVPAQRAVESWTHHTRRVEQTRTLVEQCLADRRTPTASSEPAPAVRVEVRVVHEHHPPAPAATPQRVDVVRPRGPVPEGVWTALDFVLIAGLLVALILFGAALLETLGS